ncbi:MAG: DNA polymerase III subunit beta [Bacteroidales bacterium]|nr:DNA polymerase III subunit beta [Bacteroidales bacterium]
MKFIVSSSTLYKNLQALSGVLSSNNTLPILDDFLFELDGQRLSITASDLETTMKVSLMLENAEESGVVAIPARILLETLKTFADIPITFSINQETLGIEISAGEGKFKLSGHNSDDFPQTPQLEDTTTITVDASVLVNAFNKTIFATGTDELRQVMLGVFCEITPEDITFVATDAHKLVKYRRTDTFSDSSASFILPKKPINNLRNILSDDDTKVKIEYNQTNASFIFENVILICRLIDGKYPNYEAVIPIENTKKLIIGRTDLLTSIKRVALFANQSTLQVRFSISGKELILTSEDLDFSNEAKERLTCNYTGEDIQIGFSSKFLQEMLSNIDTEQVCLELSESNRAGLVLPVDNPREHELILMLIMPVMLNQEN